MAYIFDGTNDRITYPNSAALNVGAGNFTVVLWHKSSTTPASGDRLFGSGTDKRYEVYYDASGNLNFACDDDIDKREVGGTAPAALTDGVWHPWIFRHDGAVGMWIYYGTGGTLTQLVFEGLSTGDIDNAETFCIGDGYNAGGYHWPGEICEFAVFKRALSTPEMQQIVDGFSPSFFNPDFHVPLIRNANDVRTGLTGTITGAAASGHAPVIQQASALYSFPAAAAGGPYVRTKVGSLTSSGALARLAELSRTLTGEL